MKQTTIPQTSAGEYRFRRFHKENPQVIQRIESIVAQLRQRGHARWGMKGIFEIIRYERALYTHSRDRFKINNDYTPYYARLVIERNPELAGFFDLRTQKEN